MTDHFVTVGDDLALPPAVKVLPGNLPDAVALRLAAGLDKVDNTTDAGKPLSDAALDARAVAGSRALASSAGHRMAPPPLTQVTTLTPSYTDLIGMLRDGTKKVFTGSGFSASQIGVSTDGVAFTWGKNFASGNGIATGFAETTGGEVLVSVKHRDNAAGKLWRSTGWNPATADATSWANVLTASGPGVHFDGRWCLHQRSVAPRWSARAGAIFVAEYGNHVNEAASSTQAAVRAYMSVDDGATWSIIFDLRNYSVDTNNHIHAIAYDPWDDRVLVTVGDNANAGVYYINGEDLDTLAITDWKLIAGTGGSSAKQATTVIPMASGLVLLPDSPLSAIRRIPRLGYRGYGVVEDAFSISTGAQAVIGAHAYQADAAGPLLLTVYSTTTSGPPAIYATYDGRTIAPVYAEASSVTTGTGLTSVVGPDKDGMVWATRNMSGSGVLLKGRLNGVVAKGDLMVSVMDYGAKGDGTTDDTAAIQAALNVGGRVYFPRGIYKITATLIVPGNTEVHIPTTSKVIAGAAIAGAMFKTSTAFVRSIQFTGGGIIDCAELADTGIHLFYFAHVRITSIRIDNAKVHGIKLGDTTAAGRSAEAVIHGVHILRLAPNQIPASSNWGIFVENSGDHSFSQVVIQSYRVGVFMASGTSALTDVHVWADPACGVFDTAFEDNGNSNVYIGCYADTPASYGFRMRQFNSRIIDCIVYNNPQYGNDNIVRGVKFEQAQPFATVSNTVFSGGDATHRLAVDVEIAGNDKTSLAYAGNQFSNVTTINALGLGGRSAFVRDLMLADKGVLPAASATLRGQVNISYGAAGKTDNVSVCVKRADGSYAWAPVIDVLTSPNGTQFQLSVGDDGALTTTAI